LIISFGSQVVDILFEFLTYDLEFSKLVDIRRHLALQLGHADQPLFTINDARRALLVRNEIRRGRAH
jgi:hypothetical protein